MKNTFFDARYFGLMIGLVAIAPMTLADSNWAACDHFIQIQNITNNRILAKIVGHQSRHSVVCKPIGTVIDFEPIDTRFVRLQRKKWPSAGQLRRLRYREMLGLCKFDGDGGPCNTKYFQYILLPQ